MTRQVDTRRIRQTDALRALGLQQATIAKAITSTHETLDALDATLHQRGQPRMAEMIELANFSAMLGNIFRSGIEAASDGRFKANRPHTYPDLLGVGDGCSNVEIKVALEKNNPKGHLIKPGPHLTVRYVLAASSGAFTPGERGDVAWVWDVRVGVLEEEHFNFSNTEGDSGKTAVINAAGMAALSPVYFDLSRCPYTGRSKHRKTLTKLFT